MFPTKPYFEGFEIYQNSEDLFVLESECFNHFPEGRIKPHFLLTF